MTQVLCEHCDNVIKLPKLKRKVLQNLVYEFYWHCPSCDHKYISYYTDKKIRRDINRQKKRWERYRKASTEDEKRRRLAEINLQDKLIKKDMDALKERMTKTLT